jgi:UDP-2,3-diacylglucosamine pyrophosphatase LpxH
MKTLIISDVHLGSRNSQAKWLSRLLTTDFERLILNGDTVNSLNLKKFKRPHWQVIAQLRALACERELVLIRGNHDGSHHGGDAFGPLDVLATLLGAELHEEYRLTVGSRQYLVLHGDYFDPTLSWPLLTDAADWCYQATQKLNKKAAKWLKRRVKRLGGVVEFVKRRAVHYARKAGCQGVIAGHTHFCDDEWIEGIHYINSGCWVDRPCTYVAIEGNQVQLCTWDESATEVATDRPRIAALAPLPCLQPQQTTQAVFYHAHRGGGYGAPAVDEPSLVD